MLLYWHGFCDVSVTLCDVSFTLSKKTLDVHPRFDSTELAEAVPIECTIGDLWAATVAFPSRVYLSLHFDEKVEIFCVLAIPVFKTTIGSNSKSHVSRRL